MCKVLIKNSKENLDFIFYNNLYSKGDQKFTTKDLVRDLKKYDSSVREEYVEDKIYEYIKKGLVKQNFKSFSLN